jgi:hypothetical protein
MFPSTFISLNRAPTGAVFLPEIGLYDLSLFSRGGFRLPIPNTSMGYRFRENQEQRFKR